MFSFIAPPLFSNDGVNTLTQIQDELIQLQLAHSEHEIIGALINLLNTIKNARASLLADKEASKDILALMAILDRKTGACVPIVMDEATHQAATLILKYCDCFRVNEQQKKITGVHPNLLGITNIFVKYNINTVISAIVASYEVEKRIYETGRLYNAEQIQRQLHALMGYIAQDATFFKKSTESTDKSADYHTQARQFLASATQLGTLSVCHTNGGTLIARGQSDAYRKALLAEISCIATGKISSTTTPIYEAVNALNSEEKINAYNKECDALIQDFEAAMNAYLKTNPEKSKTKMANNILAFIKSNKTNSTSAFSKINELQNHLISQISTVTLGRLYEMMLEMRAKAILQLVKCDASCDSMLRDELKKHERKIQEQTINPLRHSEICGHHAP